MRKVIVYNRVTLDGFYAGDEGSIDWFVQDPQVDRAAHEIMHPDTMLFGRLTYEQFEAFWPAVATAPGVPEPMRVMARELNQMHKIVFSRTLTDLTWENSTLATSDLATETEKAKQTEGGDIVIFGSGTVVRQLAAAGLIDEYVLVVTPVVLGSGQALFEDCPEFTLELQQSRSFASGNVLIHYTVAG